MRFAENVAHPDICLFRTSLLLARKEGASLAPSLQRLNRVTRQRQSFRRKIKAALAMQKLSSIGIAGCAVVIGVIQVLTNAQAFQEALMHPLGQKVLAAGLVLIAGGVLWMMRLSRARV